MSVNFKDSLRKIVSISITIVWLLFNFFAINYSIKTGLTNDLENVFLNGTMLLLLIVANASVVISLIIAFYRFNNPLFRLINIVFCLVSISGVHILISHSVGGYSEPIVLFMFM